MVTVVGNLKGGSGKSTVTFNLAVWLALHGRPVVLFDLDPQATLSDVVEVRQEEGHEPRLTVFRAESDPVKVLKNHPGEVLVDVGASNLWAMRQAIGLADRLVVPVPPSQADVWSTQRFLHIVAETVQGKTAKPEILVFVNRADTHPGLRESNEAEEALHAMGDAVRLLKQRLCQRTVYRRSFSEGLGVFEQEPAGKAAQEFQKFAEILYPGIQKDKKKK